MGFCNLPLADKLCAVGDAVDFASDPGKAIGDWMAKSAGELAAASADLAAKAVDTTTRVDLNAGWFRDNYEMLLPLGLVLLVATFCAQLVRAAIRRDGQALTQAFTGTMSGVLFAFCAIALTTVAIEVVDALSDGLFRAAKLDIASAVRRIVKVNQIPGLAGLGWLVAVVAGLGAAIGAVLYWCVMMVRKVGILVMVTLAVFASAGGGWEVARRWRRGWIEATATLVVSKLLMTVIFVLGIAAMGKTESKDGIAALADVMSGIVIMVLVLLCPYAVFKFVHWAADGTDGESIHRAGGAGAQMAKAHAEKAARKAAAAAATAGTGGAAVGAGDAAAMGSAAPQGPDGGGFPGDVAANPTGGGGEGKDGSQGGGTGGLPGGDAVKSGLEKAVQPAPTSVSDDTSGQVGGTPGSGGSGANAASGQGGGWQTTPPTTTPPPQGAPPSSGSPDSASSGSAPPPPPTGL
ncbi:MULTISPECIES: SCO6881 family protein [Streptomyces]|uniref:ATP-binding protein n=1 Tax=Streptomyces coelicolor (strain ATCC BAA-471 / A3(2) / M145) TaxID=100226 RepID=Q9L1N4_STRCO|nr:MULTISPECIES: ATP-binding protein [Streptomyces]MYU46387.1 ATP-binding protein [Streptomyces sp. SID7813]MDX2929196.1 ATP-binding protein [Streptomyces sp. NRRL_B-16638]MDX3412248.1 ATP-binding protein [Streptomyces sp. ME02-6977A]NSL84587.1 ATP-binding protein [Streptomyces coelicolor]QFI46660.1 ATP-binding protein [Streptomyces coelicolor A3(2)]